MDNWLGTTFELDLLNQLAKVTDHKGNVVEYTYDAEGNLTYEYKRDTTASNAGLSTTYSYDARNRLSSAYVINNYQDLIHFGTDLNVDFYDNASDFLLTI